MKKIGNLLFILNFLFFTSYAKAANYKVEAQVDRDQMGIGDSFTLNIRISGDDDFQVQEPKAPNIPGIELLNSWAGGRQSATRMEFINGKSQYSTSVSQDYNFQFSPQKEGNFTIPMIDVTIAGQTYHTNPIKIEVDEKFRGGAPRQKKNQPRGRPQFPPGFGDDEDDSPLNNPFQDDEDDLFSQLMKQRQRMFGQLPNQGRGFAGPSQQIPSRKLDVNMNDAFFVYLDLDKTEVYEGEQVTANWSIYTRGNLESLDRVKFPDLKGFWKEIIEEVPSLQFTPEIVNGVVYQKALLASHALFPIKAGTAIVDEFKVKGKVRIASQFGWGQSNEYTKVSKRTPIKVLPLPLEGRPISFSGAVGTYRMSAKTDGTTFPANQPFSVHLRFEGLGNAKLIELPNIQWPDGVEVFDTKNDSKFFKDGQSYKDFEILVIPRKEGDLKIPGISFSYFDPSQKKYVTQTTEDLNLKITPGQPQNSMNNSATGSTTKSAPVAEYKPEAILELPQSSFVFADQRLIIYGVIAALIALFSSVSFAFSYRKLKMDPNLRQTVDAKLRLIENEKDPRRRGSEAVNLIYILAAYLAGQKRANQEWHQLVKEIPLKSQGLYLDRLTQLFDYFQILGFSPEDVMRALLNQHPVEGKIKDLKKISEEISVQAQAEEKV